MFASLVITVLGGLMFFGMDPAQRGAVAIRAAQFEPIDRVERPEMAGPPLAMADLAAEQAKAEAAAKKKEQAKVKARKLEEAGKKKQAAEVFDQDPPDPPTVDLYLTVPKMGLYDNYVANTSDQAAMDNGAIKIPETGFPWQPNANTYIAAHVLGYAGTGSYMQFANLPNMTYGDGIFLSDANGTTFKYAVTEIMTVTPQDNWVTAPIAGKDMVTLQTCVNPPYYDQRLVVRAERVDVQQA